VDFAVNITANDQAFVIKNRYDDAMLTSIELNALALFKPGLNDGNFIQFKFILKDKNAGINYPGYLRIRPGVDLYKKAKIPITKDVNTTITRDKPAWQEA